MNAIKIYTTFIREFNKTEITERSQYALVEFKELTGMSDEQILRDIDRVLLQSNVKVYTPLAGNIDGWQEQTLCADMLGSRRWLTYFRTLDTNGKPKHPPRDPMRVLIIEMYLLAFYHLEMLEHKKLKNQSIVLQHNCFQQPDA